MREGGGRGGPAVAKYGINQSARIVAARGRPAPVTKPGWSRAEPSRGAVAGLYTQGSHGLANIPGWRPSEAGDLVCDLLLADLDQHAVLAHYCPPFA
jgi:hypothetical protein